MKPFEEWPETEPAEMLQEDPRWQHWLCVVLFVALVVVALAAGR